MTGQRQLLEILDALRPSCGLACDLHGRQEQGGQHADDGDDDQEFN